MIKKIIIKNQTPKSPYSLAFSPILIFLFSKSVIPGSSYEEHIFHCKKYRIDHKKTNELLNNLTFFQSLHLIADQSSGLRDNVQAMFKEENILEN
jgi:hypothetical protein